MTRRSFSSVQPPLDSRDQKTSTALLVSSLFTRKGKKTAMATSRGVDKRCSEVQHVNGFLVALRQPRCLLWDKLGSERNAFALA